MRKLLPTFTLLALLAGQALSAADYYVSEKGKDSNPGTSATEPFLTLQHADAVVKPGDTVWIMPGTYRNTPSERGGTSLLEINTSGTPQAWITWRNYSKERPELIAQGCWSAIDLKASYIVIDGLILTGNNDNVRQTDAEANAEIDVAATQAAAQAAGVLENTVDYSATPSLGSADASGAPVAKPKPKTRVQAKTFQRPSPLYNGSGINVDGRSGASYHHHILRNLVVRKFGTAGIAVLDADYYTVENCEVYDNAWYGTYGGSGITQNGGRNFDTAPGYHVIIRGNRVWNNKCLIRCFFVDLYTDGNGIIIDTLDKPDASKSFTGAVLVENNLVYNNGGSGIHVFKTHHAPVDIVSNTVWRNQQVWQLYDLGAHNSTNVRFFNNIVVADKYRQVNGKPDAGITYDYNLYSGSPLIGARGEHDLVGDPLFVRPSTNRAAADFTLRPGSPALDSAGPDLVPATDLLGVARPQGKAADRGAFEQK